MLFNIGVNIKNNIKSKNKLILRILYHLGFYEIGFYLLAYRWHNRNKKLKNITTKDIYKLFYLDFLKVPPEDCKILEMSEKKLITRCKNECPILELSLYLNIDTKKSCKKISEGPCKYFLKKLDKNIVFKRNYFHIRPYEKSCEEEIIIKNN